MQSKWFTLVFTSVLQLACVVCNIMHSFLTISTTAN
jgi:hypothetical protein